MAGPWLYSIKSDKGTFKLSDARIAVNVENYRKLVENGRIVEDDRWGVHKYKSVEIGDELYICTRDDDQGIIGFAVVEEVRPKTDAAEWIQANPELGSFHAILRLRFDLEKCRALLEKPVPPSVVKRWGLFLRTNVVSLSDHSTELYSHLPWTNSNQNRPVTAAGDGPERDIWGFRTGTGAAAINSILLAAERPLNVEEIQVLVRERGLTERGAVTEHLWTLRQRGLVTRTPEGFVRTSNSDESKPRLNAEESGEDFNEIGPYTPDNVDRRLFVERQIAVRRGQQAFRNALRKRYGDQCQITKCSVLAVLEAAHINPYRGEADHHVENGVILRADIHTLFDLDLLGIHPDSLRIELHPDVASDYMELRDTVLNCPHGYGPSVEQLEIRYQSFTERCQKPA